MANSEFIEVQKYLKGVDYPASKQDILRQAEQNGAEDDVREALEQLPEEDFDSPTQVSRALARH